MLSTHNMPSDEDVRRAAPHDKPSKDISAMNASYYLHAAPNGDGNAFSLFNINPYSFAMGTELRCVHALYTGNAIAEITGMCYE